jgi:enamine deaminase RidA (YjgF/YER057c/UK114 family)
MPDRVRISQGSTFERDIGYSRAIVDGRWVFVSGTTGYDYATMTISPSVVDQCRQALANVDDALRRAGATAGDVVRVRYLLPDRADFESCWPLLRDYFAAARPAATMMEVGLSTPEMKIEIEVTALKPEGAATGPGPSPC